MQLFIKCGSRYKPASKSLITEAAASYAETDINSGAFTNYMKAIRYLHPIMGKLEYESFGVLFLDSQHRIIEFKTLFRGTIDQASIYPREIVKHALNVNSAAVILTHNHPSGDATPSDADCQITKVIKGALNFVDVRTLDHIVFGDPEVVAFSQLGYL